MTQNNTIDNDEIDLAELFYALWAHKFFIGIWTALAIVCAGYYALTTDKEYTAKAVFEIQQGDNGRGFSLPGDLGALASLAGVSAGGTNSTDALLERVKSKEYILDTNEILNFENDPYFNNYSPNQTDPLWKATIKNLIGWKSDKRTADAIIEGKVVETFKESISVSTTDAGAISLSVTHEDPNRAAFYANELMEFTRDLVLDEQEESTDLRLNYLSETLADALQEMERSQERLKQFALENSTVADQSFVAGSLQLDRLRVERQDALEFTTTLTRLEELVKLGAMDQSAYLALRDANPMIDDVRFRRIMGMSETITELRSEVRSILIRNGLSPKFQLDIVSFASQRAYISVGNAGADAGTSSAQVVTLTDKPITLRELLSRSGVGFSQSVETYVRLQRSDKTYVMKLRTLYSGAAQDIVIQDRDHVFVESSISTKTETVASVGQNGSAVLEGLGRIKLAGRTLSDIEA